MVKVGDFGLIGSLFAIAPEIITIGEYDERADIYSLGIMFYEILFGESPFQLSDKFIH